MSRLYWIILTVIAFGGIHLVVAQCEAQDDLIEMIATVDNPTPYVGQQVIYTVAIWNNTLSSPVPETPPFEGFWLAGLLGIHTEERANCDIVSGVTTTEHMLFPLKSGRHIIPPGSLDFSRNPVYQATTRVESNAVELDVQPLPTGAPLSFKGAVGGPFFISAQIGRTAVDIGDPVSLSVVVEGVGNIEQLDAPDLNLPDGWRVYSQAPRFEAASDNRVLVGKKTFEWLFVPATEGTVTLSPIEFSYFDTNLLSYRSVATEPIFMAISAGSDIQLVEPIERESISGVSDVLPIKPVPASLNSGMVTMINGWWLWIVPPAIIMGVVAWGWYTRLIWRERTRRRRSNALRIARNRLVGVPRRKGDEAYKLIIQAIFAYFGDHWNMESRTMSHSDIQDRLFAGGVDDGLVDRLFACLEAAEEGRYVPSGASPQAELVKETLIVLMEIDSVLP